MQILKFILSFSWYKKYIYNINKINKKMYFQKNENFL